MTDTTRSIELLRSWEEEMRAFLKHAVNQDSPSTNKSLCDAVGNTFEGKAQEYGFVTEIDRQTEFGDNIVARLHVGESPSATRVLLVGHMDTVFEDDTTKQRPYTEKNGIAYGPGVYDMKAGLVIGLYAIRAARMIADDWRLPLTFIFNSDEEPGSPKSRDVVRTEARDHNLALILEPGTPEPAITVARKGVGIFSLHVTGQSAHAGMEPEKGVNSIVDIARRIEQIAKLADKNTGTTVNVGVVKGGTQPYVVPSEASCRVDVRVPTIAEQERIEQGLEKIARAEGYQGAKCVLEGSFHRPPFEPSEEAKQYISLYTDAAAELNYPLGSGGTGGASDGNLTAALGVPTLDGLGAQGGNAHRPDEFIKIDSLVMKAAVLTEFLLKLNKKNS